MKPIARIFVLLPVLLAACMTPEERAAYEAKQAEKEAMKHASCSTYEQRQHPFLVEASFDEVWQASRDIIVGWGYSIETVDREEGILVGKVIKDDSVATAFENLLRSRPKKTGGKTLEGITVALEEAPDGIRAQAHQLDGDSSRGYRRVLYKRLGKPFHCEGASSAGS